MKEIVFLSSCVVLAVVPVVFVANRVYQDGIVGRVALLAISFAADMYLLDFTFGVRYTVLPQTAFFFAAVALFLCWHLWRFHRRVLRRTDPEKTVPNWVPH